MRSRLPLLLSLSVLASWGCGPLGAQDSSAGNATAAGGGGGGTGAGDSTGGAGGGSAAPSGSGANSGGGGPVATAGAGGATPAGAALTSWVHKMGGLGIEWTHDVAVAPDGSLVAFNVIGVRGESLEQIGFVHIGAGGDEFDAQFENESGLALHFAPSGSFVVDPAGKLIVAAAGICAGSSCPVVGGHAVRGGAVTSLSSRAEFGWQAPLPGNPISNVAVGADGDVLVAAATDRGGVVRRLHGDGSAVWDRGTVDVRVPCSVALTGTGDALVGNGATVSAYDRAGAKRWDRPFGGGTVVLAIAAGPAGVRVLGRYTSAFALGDATLTPPAGSDHGTFVAALAADGTPQWARDLGVVQETSDATADPKALLAAAEDGGAVVVTGADACTAAVVSIDGAGAPRWRRPVAAGGCGGRDLVVHSVAVAGTSRILLGGAMSAPIDFGTGTLTALATDAFVVSLSQ